MSHPARAPLRRLKPTRRHKNQRSIVSIRGYGLEDSVPIGFLRASSSNSSRKSSQTRYLGRNIAERSSSGTPLMHDWLQSSVLSPESSVRPKDVEQISLLAVEMRLKERAWDEAFEIYRRMKEDNQPGQEEALSRLLKTSVTLPANPLYVDEAILDAPLMLRTINEKEIQAVMAHLIRCKTSISVIRSLFSQFQEKKGERWRPSVETCALMVQAEAQTGYDIEAEDFLRKGKQQAQGELSSDLRHDAVQRLYTSLFVGSAAFRRDRPAFFHKILLRMRRERVQINQRISNIITEAYLKDGRQKQSFAFYKAMRRSTPPVPPNAHTFFHLYSSLASNALDPATRRRDVSRRGILYDGRKLFKDMTSQHIRNTEGSMGKQSPAIDTNVLNASIRFFLGKRDYAAATVAVRTFPVCSVVPNKYTESSIVDGLMARIEREITAAAKSSYAETLWADRMLGEVIRHWDGAWRTDVITKLLRTVGEASRSIGGLQPNIRAILALLRRAIIASFDLWPGEQPKAEATAVAKAIRQANLRMLPSSSRYEAWSGDPIFS